ncbi:Uma2 family endonuclease [soil metagenome]
MTAMPVADRMTAGEYLARPYDPRERGAELIGGEIVMDEPLLPHQLVWSELFHELVLWSRAATDRGLVTPPIDVLIGPHDVYGPDILWYRADRLPGRRDPRPYPVPDLAVEVRSPSTWRYDIGAKKAGYERGGLLELWLVDNAADVVLVFRRSRPDAPEFDVALELTRDDTLTSPLLPGFAVALDAVFAE